ncbi:MAG: hypothetical protein SFX18_15755 [Pirellulales bacterium]|nr:hypothetical protein [Pirellulales bacterium]
MSQWARVIGIHPIPAEEAVHLVELESNTSDFDFGVVTQEVFGQPQSNWQAAYDELQIGEKRFAFFFHYLDTTKPLMSAAGLLDLPPESTLPEHLQDIKYEKP